MHNDTTMFMTFKEAAVYTLILAELIDPWEAEGREGSLALLWFGPLLGEQPSKPRSLAGPV
jgi:hypothetical protein